MRPRQAHGDACRVPERGPHDTPGTPGRSTGKKQGIRRESSRAAKTARWERLTSPGAGKGGAPFLTAKDATADRIAGLTASGDNYVAETFSLDEVILRVRAIPRRTRHSDADAEDGVPRSADLELDRIPAYDLGGGSQWWSPTDDHHASRDGLGAIAADACHRVADQVFRRVQAME
ncbi:hypothetical protein [Actinomadura sp. NEAU-AAG7]|uniref:hypothetical protein n=1 Tax=Actinomadura sp. NEAU-AAG7 TaxID=2839640 RepID=UPI001BE463F9|nr:hypothetical protein [Actinomadura sp. NEAU-AAG7]MBT2213535.1 hypothetical protein [Actinomadura sp. NEAU-AAG7]